MSMKRKRITIAIIIILPLLIIISSALFLTAYYYAPYRYVENCFYSNKQDFEMLAGYFKEPQGDGAISEKINENDLPEALQKEAKAILGNLQEQYQKDSDYPVFTSVYADYDENGNVLLYLQVKKEKLKNKDGIDSPDIRCYYLVYIDENYNGSSGLHIDKKQKNPFCDNWYSWSSDTYSG